MSLFRLDGKVSLVTGGSKGIGFGMAQGLGEHGAKVVIASRGKEDLEKAHEKLIQQGIEASYYPLDVTNKEDVNRAIDFVVSKYGSLDILVNNAGTNKRKPLLEVEEEDWELVLNTNLKGIFLMGQAAARQMTKQESGRIINISSIFGGVGKAYQSSYAASKGGINQLTRVWADELSEKGITVNAIAPAYIKTPMTEQWLDDKDRYQEIVNSTMVKRVGRLDELKGPAVFLASEASSYVTGQVLYVDGGWTAK
ncbi:SDR family NAD(P)-dependent oxidoreductase [Thalassobacillus sp. C254]|uniref:SDR family NAD(P)-dependent oxidoreductase n=1 Tax=Thalassobacillus sp. C254 TaxID=1225341 RepID=UPI0006D082A4|nr:glucose 1-dehydrogenase [Thalassobacillus sp. C254]